MIEKLEQVKEKQKSNFDKTSDKDYAVAVGATQNCINIVKQHSEWISVDERLPNEDGECLVYVDATKFKGGKFIDMEFFKTSINAFCYFMGEAEVTHWMPIPQPPSEVQP